MAKVMAVMGNRFMGYFGYYFSRGYFAMSLLP